SGMQTPLLSADTMVTRHLLAQRCASLSHEWQEPAADPFLHAWRTHEFCKVALRFYTVPIRRVRRNRRPEGYRPFRARGTPRSAADHVPLLHGRTRARYPRRSPGCRSIRIRTARESASTTARARGAGDRAERTEGGTRHHR